MCFSSKLVLILLTALTVLGVIFIFGPSQPTTTAQQVPSQAQAAAVPGPAANSLADRPGIALDVG